MIRISSVMTIQRHVGANLYFHPFRNKLFEKEEEEEEEEERGGGRGGEEDEGEEKVSSHLWWYVGQSNPTVIRWKWM